jgi:sugar lactone lactonase YvrE
MANNKDFKVKNGIQPTVYHEGLGTVTSGSVGYSLANLTQLQEFSTTAQIDQPMGITFKPDGTEMYVVDITPDDVSQYTLSTAWDLSTASYTGAFSVAGQETAAIGVTFKTDGTKMFVSGQTGDDINEYSLSTAWDISTASYTTTYNPSEPPANVYGHTWKPDGTKFYLTSAGSPYQMFEYTCSTAWDISTASYSGNSYTFSLTTPRFMEFSLDGLFLFIEGNPNVYKYPLTTAYDLSTVGSVAETISIPWGSSYGIYFTDSGQTMFASSANLDKVIKYSTVLNTAELDLSTGSVFEITPTSDIQINLSNPADSGTVSQATLLLDGGGFLDFSNASYDSVSFSLSSQDTSPIEVFVKPDGTKMYIVGNNNESIFQYSLSTAYDLSTASYDSVSFSVSSQDTIPFGLFFKPDGTKMYVCGWGNDSVYEYDLSTAWDISSASYNSVVLNVTTQDPRPSAIFFKPDGAKMYMVGDEYNAVYQYSLSTAWDLSTASYDSVSFSVGSQDGEPKGLSFTSSGEDMFIAGDITGDIYHYSLSTAFDISTASYVDSLSHSSQASSPVGISIKQGNDKMYVVDINGVAVYQYTIGSGVTITYPNALEWPSGTAPTSPAIGETDVLTFSTTDGGTTYQAVQAISGAS